MKKKIKNDEKMISKVTTRLFSGIILIIALFIVLYFGGKMLFLSCMLLSILGLIELFRVFKLANSRLAYVGYLFTILYYIVIYIYKSSGILLVLIALTMLLLSFYVFSFPKFNIKQVSMIFFSIIYVAVTFSFIYLIREKTELGKYYVWLIFIASWGSDTFAYCSGLLFGKHKLSPILSPKKSIEGAVGGIIGAFALGTLYAYLVMYKFFEIDITISSIRVGIACGLGAIISMIGDLTASAIKRDYGVKDYGNIIPGHGGILDRFDSVIFTAPALFFLLNVY